MSMMPKNTMSYEELYFRFLIAIFGIAITAGAFIIDVNTMYRVIQVAGGTLSTVIIFIWRLKK